MAWYTEKANEVVKKLVSQGALMAEIEIVQSNHSPTGGVMILHRDNAVAFIFHRPEGAILEWRVLEGSWDDGDTTEE